MIHGFYRILLLAPLLSGEMVLSIISIAGFTLATMPPFWRPNHRELREIEITQLPRHQTILNQQETRRVISSLLESSPPPEPLPDLTQREVPPPSSAIEIVPVDDGPLSEKRVVPEATTLVAPPPEDEPPQPVVVDKQVVTVSASIDRIEEAVSEYNNDSPMDGASSPSRVEDQSDTDDLLLMEVIDEDSLEREPFKEEPLDNESASVGAPTQEESEPSFEIEERVPPEELQDEIEEEIHFWLSTRERADAIFMICPLYDELQLQKLPLALLIGEMDQKNLSKLTSEQLDRALAYKQEVDELCDLFGFDEPQSLFDHVFHCSISHQREGSLKSLLSTITPIVLESTLTAEDETREACYREVVHHLVDYGEFLSSERDEMISKWHQEHIPIDPPINPEAIEEITEDQQEEEKRESVEITADEVIDSPTEAAVEVAEEEANEVVAISGSPSSDASVSEPSDVNKQQNEHLNEAVGCVDESHIGGNLELPVEIDNGTVTPHADNSVADRVTEEKRVEEALENLKRERVEQLPEQPSLLSSSPEQPAAPSRREQIKTLNRQTQQHGISLDNLLQQEKGSSKEARNQLLNLLLSARGELPEEFSPYRGHLRGSGTDLLIESLLRVQLQDRVCHLYSEFSYLSSYEAIQQQIFNALENEFGAELIHNHHASIETHIEWASSEGGACTTPALHSGL